MPGDLTWLTRRPIAHRGLHDARLPENSLAAAKAAACRGFAVECDVLLSSDGVPVVFHDDRLDRLTGEVGLVGDRTAGELYEMTLLRSEERIPSVEAFLAAIDGSVPIVMELKGTSPEADEAFLRRLSPMLDAYGGALALMSFDPWLVEQALAYAERPVGLTAEGTASEVLAVHRAVFDLGCSFVSYNVEHLPNEFVRHVREDRGAPVITWTVRTPAEVAATKAHADQMTFEGFLPQD